jgi:hypothetical protein
MKTLFYIYTFFMVFSSWTQKEEIIHHHKFPNGKTSTISVIIDNRDGYAKAYNLKGQVIYERTIRRYAGHASVYFQHHPNGMVKKAEYSSHPDGGIQWYRTYTYFDEQGNITSEIEDNWDTRVTVQPHFRPDTTHVHKPQPVKSPSPDPLSPEINPPTYKPTTVPRPDPLSPDINPTPVEPTTVPNPIPVKPETIQCATIHKNRTEFTNHSKHTILLSISHQGKDTIVVLKPGRVYNGPTYISAEIASPMIHNVRFQFNPKKKNVAIENTVKAVVIGQYETLHIVSFYGKKRRTKKQH